MNKFDEWFKQNYSGYVMGEDDFPYVLYKWIWKEAIRTELSNKALKRTRPATGSKSKRKPRAA